jgi:membrane associated rhomboid family serine protease
MLLFLVFILSLIISLFLQSIVFPFPLSDTGHVRYGSIPWMTILLIAINSLVFLIFQAPGLYQGSQLLDAHNQAGYQMIYQGYIVPLWTYGHRIIFLRDAVGIGAFSTFTSMFMHGNLDHLLGNMIYLWAFGRRVEDACGSARYLLFYLLAGMVATIGSSLLNRAQADIPGIGASGAIAGVMGAYLILFPGSMVTCFWGIGIILRVPAVALLKLFTNRQSFHEAPWWRWTIKLPAFTFLIVWLAMNTLPSLDVIQRGRSYGGVDTLAHLTGFLAALLIFLFVRKDLLVRYVAGRSL